MTSSEDPDIEIIKARKLRELQEKARRRAATEQQASNKHADIPAKSPKEIVLAYLYDRGDEVLRNAEAQYPAQTQAIVKRIAELISDGEIQSKISGGELLSLFRSVGLNVRVNTSIRIEDHGKLVSFSDKLKMDSE